MKIPSKEDLLGVTALIISVSYKKKEFFRCGYYVYNNYYEQELIENDPQEVIITRVMRNILSDKPRITRFDINWDLEDEPQVATGLNEIGGGFGNVLQDTTNYPQNYGASQQNQSSSDFLKPQQSGMNNAGFMGFSNGFQSGGMGGFQIANPFASNSTGGIFEQLNSIPAYDSSMNMYGGSLGSGLYGGENMRPGF